MKIRVIGRHFGLCLLSCGLAGITEVLQILISLMMGNAIDLSLSGQLNKLLGTCLGLLALTLIMDVIFAFAVYCKLVYSQKSACSLRECLIDSFFRRDLHSFRKKDDAYYANLLSMDMEKICESYYGNFSSEIMFMILFIGSVVAMAWIHPILFAVALVFALLPYLITWAYEKGIQRRTKATSAANEACQFQFLQLIQGYETLKLSGLDLTGVKARARGAIQAKARAQIRQDNLQSFSYQTMDLLNAFGQLLLLGAGGWLIVTGKITAGQLVSCTVLTTYVCNGINNYLELHLARKATKPLREKVEAELSGLPAESAAELPTAGQDVSYDHVGFRFDSKKEYLFRDVTFRLESGGYCAVVGESGRGKTTLIKLLLRYYPDYEGTITLFGRDLAQYSERQLYRMVGILSQNEYILNASLFENITLCSQGISETDEEYLSLLERLNLSALARRAGDRPLGDFGDHISGGERQRIALARVLLKKPKLLILDEPTTGLDPENREAINGIIRNLQGLTRIVITHDQSPEYLGQFDQVLYLEEGGALRVQHRKGPAL